MTPEEIKHIRELTLLPQSKFGHLLGVSQTTIALWENGERTPPAIYVVVMMRLEEKITSFGSMEIHKTLLNFFIVGGIKGFITWLFD